MQSTPISSSWRINVRVLVTGLEGSLLPAELVATTVNEYAFPEVKPSTTQSVSIVVHIRAPGLVETV